MTADREAPAEARVPEEAVAAAAQALIHFDGPALFYNAQARAALEAAAPFTVLAAVVSVQAPDRRAEGRTALLDCMQRMDPDEPGLTDEVRAERRGYNVALVDLASISMQLDESARYCACGHHEGSHVFRVLADRYTDCRVEPCDCAEFRHTRPEHDEQCESEFIEGPMSMSPCGCAERASR